MSGKQIEELGLALGILGAVVLAWGSLMMLRASRSYNGPSDGDHRREKWSHVVGALLIGVGFAGSLWRLLGK